MMRRGVGRGVQAAGGRHFGVRVAAVGLAMAAARALDLASTHMFDPDLLGEQNLLRTLFGAGFATLVAVNVAVVALLCLLYARSLRLQPRIDPPPAGLGLAAFLSFFLYAGHHPWWHIAFRRPGRTRARWLLGRMVPWPAIGVSLLAVAGNVLAHSGGAASRAWTALVGGPVRLVLTLATFVLLVLAAWLCAEYLAYRAVGAPRSAGG
jgi:hypothetical protein